MANPVFYHNQTSNKSFFDKLMLMLVGPAFSTPAIALLILIIIELQRIVLLFNITVSNFDDDNSFARPFLSVIYWTTGFIPDESSKGMSNIDVGIGFIFVIIGVLWLIFGLVFFRASLSHKVSLELTNWLRKISFFYQGIMYALFYNILIVAIKNVAQDNGELSDSNIYKNAGIVIMIVLIAMNFLTGFAIVAFCYEPLYFSHDVLARRSNFHFLLSFLEKTLIITLFTFIQDEENRVLITSIVTLILQFLDLLIFVRDLPWYNPVALKIEATFTLLSIFISILNIVFSFAGNDTTVGFALLAGFLLIIFAVKAAHNLVEGRINRALDKHVSNYKSEPEIFVYFMMLEKIIGNGRYSPQFDQKMMPHSYPFYLMGFIKKHSKRCQIARCACKFYVTNAESKAFHRLKTGEELTDAKAFTLEDQNILHEELMYFFKKDYLQRITVAFPQWHHLKLTLANYIIDKQYENKIKALLLVYEVEKMTDSFVLKTKISQLKSIIEKALKNDEKSTKIKKQVNLDVKNFIFSHTFFEDLQQGISKQVKQHFQFWQQVEASEPPMAQLLKTSVKCEKHYQALRKKWAQGSRKIDPSFLQVFLYYGIFLRVVKNAREEADNVLRKATRDYRNAQHAQKTEKGIDLANLYNENNIVIRISLQSDKFGHMMAVTGNVAEYFGYDAPMIVGQNVNLLMPEFIKERHDDILKAYLNTGRDSMINTNRKVFGMHRNGFLIPVTMYLTPFPYIDNDYSIMAILKKTRSSEDIIMLSPDGMIQGITKTIADKLGIPSDSIFDANVSAFCEKFQNINMVFNYFAYIKMKTTQARMKVYEQTDILDRQEFAEKSEALLTFGTEVFNFKSSGNQRSIDESPLLAMNRERTTQDTLRDKNLLRSLKSSKFKREFRSSLAKAMAPQPQGKPGQKQPKTESTSFEMKTPKNNNSESPIKVPSSSTINKPKPKNHGTGVTSLNSEGPYMRAKGDVDLIPGNQKHSSYRSSDGGSAKSFFTQGQKIVKEFQQVLKSEQSLKAYAPTHLPSFYARDSMLASRTMLDRASIFNKFAPIAKDISAQARALLHEEYKNIYEQFLYQGQMVRFTRFDSNGKVDTTKELFYFVKVHDEKVHHDILRIFTIANTEKRSDYDAYGSGLSSESYDIDDASIHSKVEQKTPENKKEGIPSPNTLLAPPSPVIRSHVVPTFSDVKSQRDDNTAQRKRNEHEAEGSIKHRVSRNPFMTRLYRKAYQLVTGEGDDINDASSVQSKKVVQNTEKKVEKAVNLDRVGKELNAVFRTILAIFTIAIGCLILIAVNATQGINNAWNIVAMLSDTCLRAINLLEVNSKIEQYHLTEDGFMNLYSLTDIAAGINDAILQSQNYNHQLRINFDELTMKYQESVYALKLDVKAEPNSIAALGTPSRNTFDLIEDVLIGARSILELEQNSGNQDNIADLTSYVYQNIMGGISVYLDQIVAIEKKNNEQVTGNTRRLNEYVFFFGAGLVLLVLIYMINNEKNFLARKKIFLTIWCTVPPKDVKIFKTALTEFNQLTNSNGPEFVVTEKTVGPSMRSLTMFKKDVKRTKEGNFHRISRRGIINLLIETFVLVIMVIMIGVLYIESLNIESSFESAVTKLQQAFMDYNYVQLGITSLYLYLGQYQDITVNNVPLSQSLDNTVDNLRNVNAVFLSLKGNDAVIEEKLQVFFNGDLCASLFEGQTGCATIGNGVLTRGLSAVQSLIAEDIAIVRTAFESSDPAINNLTTILSSDEFVTIEQIYSAYVKETFISLTETLENDFHSDIQSIKSNYIKIIVVFGVLVVVILIPISEIGKRNMFADRINLRRTLRMVSTNYILDQKIFRAALVRDIGADIAFI